MKFGYARVSTRDQHPEVQVGMLVTAGVEEENILVDKGVSGRKASRPQWDILKGKMREGDVLYITKLDRMGRSVINLVKEMAWLRDQGIELVVTTQGIDTTTAMGRFVFTIMAGLAEMEAELIRERTLDGLVEAARQGHRSGPGKKLSPARITSLKMRFTRGDDIRELCEDYGISKPTLYRYVAHDGGRKPE